jgi:lysophospholipase L1-like esterase
MLANVRIISGRLIFLIALCCLFAGCVAMNEVTPLIPQVQANDPTVKPVPRTDPAVQNGWWTGRHEQAVKDFAEKKDYDFIFIGNSTRHVIWRLNNGEFPNEDGSLKTQLFREDQLHLSVKGYGVWKEKLFELAGEL